MTVIQTTRRYHSTEAPYSVPNDEPEWERLDDMTRGFKAYMGGKLTLAPLDNPKRILEIGAGSGAWLIQAAQTYPDAEVVAVDISDLPPRPFPSNVRFVKHNAIEPLPFEPESFDVIHMRALLIHLPDVRKHLAHFASRVRPGGFLLVEEIALFSSKTTPETRQSDAYRAAWGPFVDHMYNNGQQTELGARCDELLKDMPGVWEKIDGRTLAVPFNPLSEDSAMATLGRSLRTSLMRAILAEQIPERVALGLTPAVQEAYERDHDRDDPQSTTIVPVRLYWAQKK
ncbi:S-adenosyl-L-methionine-dependent methyltransferase [Schizophyllum amplum]|uniref:S-adenosyl-L-methionine-dependent methyltransferase n=1 Tax=Schizophyllum amplum TaxID=97359 RepID=A0A550C6F3_9AGAR|nr:S-adenosyl-L-methionine-dependent methyltransferase [Auriculariopsis ampla]